MDNNRFAPPKANVEGAYSEVAAAPPLWNPNAAASWSLLFSPIFGTWLHLRNWQAMGDHERAGHARKWLIASFVMLLVSIVLAVFLPPHLGGVTRIFNFAFLIAWYYAAAKPQVAFVKGHYGDHYPRRGWLVPIATAIGVIVASLAALVALAMMLGARA
ncbi:hypothetical protein [Scleromatobacter humisilvae]|uniref:Uncharacterized protein n=1 Tax=Scleromatobacter humisilvae TaxID=2897159 RepID=A0A9X1YDS8_9BURK|nr:hypothetical protein [Scleromatobacter humisilvae]MCK9684314.1 hypothetical protein [Scleromatobacter humisilvae]